MCIYQIILNSKFHVNLLIKSRENWQHKSSKSEARNITLIGLLQGVNKILRIIRFLTVAGAQNTGSPKPLIELEIRERKKNELLLSKLYVSSVTCKFISGCISHLTSSCRVRVAFHIVQIRSMWFREPGRRYHRTIGNTVIFEVRLAFFQSWFHKSPPPPN